MKTGYQLLYRTSSGTFRILNEQGSVVPLLTGFNSATEAIQFWTLKYRKDGMFVDINGLGVFIMGLDAERLYRAKDATPVDIMAKLFAWTELSGEKIQSWADDVGADKDEYLKALLWFFRKQIDETFQEKSLTWECVMIIQKLTVKDWADYLMHIDPLLHARELHSKECENIVGNMVDQLKEASSDLKVARSFLYFVDDIFKEKVQSAFESKGQKTILYEFTYPKPGKIPTLVEDMFRKYVKDSHGVLTDFAIQVPIDDHLAPIITFISKQHSPQVKMLLSLFQHSHTVQLKESSQKYWEKHEKIGYAFIDAYKPDTLTCVFSEPVNNATFEEIKNLCSEFRHSVIDRVGILSLPGREVSSIVRIKMNN